jgi:DNA-directed RNA polymerase subunit E'/Rpb7
MSNIYRNTIIRQTIPVEFNKNEYNMTRYFINYAKEFIEGKCRKEGFVRPKSVQIISYTAPILKDNNCLYEVSYNCDVCNPEIEEFYTCKIIKIAKIGIRAVISYSNNPIVFYISREHNSNVNFDNYKEGDELNVKIIGKRFQLNDTNIEVIAEIV